MLKLAFEYLTESYSLLEDPTSNYIIMAIVGVLAFAIAYLIVGFLYDADMIDGSMIGNILHWIIRVFAFLMIYYAMATMLRIYRWIKSVPAYVWWLVFAFLIILCTAIMYTRRKRRNHDTGSYI